ncbi:Ppx/GppA phosphatase family protein [Thermosyntropha sp.]|uniref:Ppx/GppA phosphatase family protein n=1 Tax=Thermosyntropha sp. TaxID=2740820 RepID=UPI0025E7E891|nr:Ppx/GppA phosphatase family protein [Thermosyntropha sp.]MBO8159759.1 Ppx/GppA family phosphatase [Thermosyntropha sp.]
MRCAAIDLGTNSCRLLIAEIKDGKLFSVLRDLQTTRLGENLIQTGKISKAAIDRTCVALNSFKKAIEDNNVASYRAIATSAVREAENQKEFIDTVLNKCGIKVEVITGEKEAFLSYLGVEKGLKLQNKPMVVDLGGGSTEFILGKDFMISLPLGAVRATEADMNRKEMRDILKPLIDSGINFKPHPLVCVGGTATTLVAIKLKLKEYSYSLVHGQLLTYEDIAEIYELLASLPLEERKKLPGLQPARADIIPKGVLAVLVIMEILNKDKIVVSESDLMEGIIWEMAN